MANNLFTNNASALLAASISSGDTVIQVDSGFGANYPSPTGTQFFYATLQDNAGNIEVVRCTSRMGDLLTVVRGQDNTTPQNFTLTITRVELRITAAGLEGFAQLDGAVFTGDIDMNGNDIIDAVLSGTSTRMIAGEIVGVPLRGDTGVSTNEVVVPSGGARATAGGVPIVVNTDNLAAQLTVAGVITLAPATGFQFGVGVGGYFRHYSLAGDYIQLSGDDTDWSILFSGVANVNFTGPTTGYTFDNDIFLADNILDRAEFRDFAVTKQSVSGVASTTINYELGSYVILTLTADITTLTLSNPPATQLGSMRLRIVQDATPRTIAWGASVKWPNNGAAPTLSAGAGAIDFVDLWTDNGGTTWYAVFNPNWV